MQMQRRPSGNQHPPRTVNYEAAVLLTFLIMLAVLVLLTVTVGAQWYGNSEFLGMRF
jgi:hypothetical protein